MANTRIFETHLRPGMLEVWLPPVNHPEGELMLAISPDYVAPLIATLKNFQESSQGGGNTATRKADRHG